MTIAKGLVFGAAVAFLAAANINTASAQDDFTGPTQGKGLSNETIGEIDLGPEIPGMDGRFMRLRYWEIQPGGIVPVHSHANRPSMIYVLEGEIIEHRSDDDEPHVYKAGEVSVEAEGVKHWWENKSDSVVKLLGYDIHQP